MSPTGRTQDRPGQAPLSLLWVILGAAVLPLYALTTFGVEYGGAGGLVVMLSAAAGYALAIAAYSLVARLAFDGRTPAVLLSIIVAIAIGYALGGSSRLGHTTGTLSIVALAPVATGWVVRRTDRFRAGYLTGLLVLLASVIAFYWSEWPSLVRDMRYLAESALEDPDSSEVLELAGLSGLPYAQTAMRMLHEMAWYLPGALTMSAVVQYSIGSLWFFHSVAKRSVGQRAGISFTRWKMPRPVVLLTLLAVLFHLIGVDGARLAADNVLFGLVIFYGVTGLAAIEFLFEAKRVPVWLRVIVYLGIGAAHVYGLIGAAVIGLVDSLFPWRRGPEWKRKESVS
ncbi:DUF2232 domain-containing protein [candidate division GN15 bacterium]|nr:DUF2232 domain-containing protein [candidate division GN15 bacterium]